MTGFMRRTFNLEFSDESFNGLEVRMRSASIGVLMRMQELLVTPLGGAQAAVERKELFGYLADAIVSWNLLDEAEQPVEHTAEQVEQEEWPLIRLIAIAWIDAVAGVPRPLSQPSRDGEQSVDLSSLPIPMETMPSTTEGSATTGESPDPTTTDGSGPSEWNTSTSLPSSSEQSGS